MVRSAARPALRSAAVAGLAVGLFSLGPAIRADDGFAAGCGMYPAAVIASPSPGWSACQLQRAGHPPLWTGRAVGARPVIRFTFTEGHGRFYRVVTITEKADGSGELVVAGNLPRRPGHATERALPTRRRALTAADLARLDRLGTETGVWEFERGSWDGDALYMHCQVLEMERASTAAYRYSSVNIGCNKPPKLMPLINEVVRLAGLKATEGGMLYS